MFFANSLCSQNIFSGGIGAGFACSCIGNANDEVPLPVKFGEINAYLSIRLVTIEWETLSEINNDYFLVEKSNDLYTWKAISNVEGKGNSNEPVLYKEFDANPSNGINYYRIQQIDYDGKTTFSKIISVSFSLSSQIVSLFPNPCSSQVTIESNNAIIETFAVYNSAGQNVTDRCETISKTNSSITLETGKLEAGIYFCRTDSGETVKFVIK